MTPEITPQQRQAIDDKSGQPIYVVDSDRHETYVLLTSSDFEKVRPALEHESASGAWTDEKNERRIDLIDRKVAGVITPNELVELAELQQQAERHFDQVAPPPMKGVRELHQRLLQRRDHAK